RDSPDAGAVRLRGDRARGVRASRRRTGPAAMTPSLGAAAITAFNDTFTAVRREIAKVIIGHERVIETILTAFFAGGHVLIEGVPGIGKTLIVRSLADALNLSFNRIQ